MRKDELPNIGLPGWLTGWKAIAAYVGRGKRTAKKWHNQFGMPVRRAPGGAPIALPYELDAWLVGFDELKTGESKKVSTNEK